MSRGDGIGAGAGATADVTGLVNPSEAAERAAAVVVRLHVDVALALIGHRKGTAGAGADRRRQRYRVARAADQKNAANRRPSGSETSRQDGMVARVGPGDDKAAVGSHGRGWLDVGRAAVRTYREVFAHGHASAVVAPRIDAKRRRPGFVPHHHEVAACVHRHRGSVGDAMVGWGGLYDAAELGIGGVETLKEDAE